MNNLAQSRLPNAKSRKVRPYDIEMGRKRQPNGETAPEKSVYVPCEGMEDTWFWKEVDTWKEVLEQDILN